jgi:serine/threonine-protein kinase
VRLGQGRHAEAETELLAGYGILIKQTSPSVTWLTAAREDPIKVYAATGEPAKAQRYRNELASVAKSES